MTGSVNRTTLLVGLAAVLEAGVAGFALRPYGIYLLSLWAVFAMAATGLNLTVGYAGQVSLVQAAFVGIGAYTTALLQPHGIPFAATAAAAGLLCFAVGWCLGYPALRVRSHYLAFVTLTFTTLVFLLMRNEDWLTGGNDGISDIDRPAFLAGGLAYLWTCLAGLAAVLCATWWLLRSPWGRAFMALRENPVRAMGLGIDIRTYTLAAFAIGAALGGTAGSFYAALVQYIEPAPFALELSLNLLLMVVLGGSGRFLGPLVGAMVAVLLPEWTLFAEDYYLILYALLVMALLMFSPAGLLGLVDRAVGLVRRPKPGGRKSLTA